jgi:hypothetical protein
VTTITGMDAGLVERNLQHHTRQYREEAAERRRVVRSGIGAWEATYWKVLPFGFQVHCFDREEDRDPLWATDEKPFAVDPEFMRGAPVWHVDPFGP